ncbi:MAG: biotin-dependent carboxyltransferase family protein [Candidatus Sedimenticola sp. (ex Thyasira tokunagai)]
MGLRIVNPGVMSMVVDIGRGGFQHIGVTVGGPMDEHAYLWANRLLGNHFSSSQIEITWGLFECEIEKPTTLAIAGADLQAEINSTPVEPWSTYAVKAGDRLLFNMPKRGLRAYLAVKGGFSLKRVLGSSTAVSRDGLGGLKEDGSKLAHGDLLPFTPDYDFISHSVEENLIPDYDQPLELGVTPGYQKDHFSTVELAHFFSAEYEITQNIDRMGYRLSGPSIQCDLDGIVSEGISYGAIQIPKDGQPIILLRDRQTIGGYPKVGCVNTLDAARLSQRGPGTVVKFKPQDPLKAEGKRMLYNRFFGLSTPTTGS